MAACTLLAVPGTAGAHVKAKYRAEYKRQITVLDKAFNVLREQLRQHDGRLADRAEIMAPMVDDPEQRETLLAHEDAALGIYNRCKDLPMQLSLTFGKSVNAFNAKARRYFATAQQQRQFKKPCGCSRATPPT